MSRTVGFAIFGVLFLVVAAGLHVYLYRRLVRDVISNRTVRMVARLLFPALVLGGFLVRMLARMYPGGVTRPVTLALNGWSGFALYVTFALLVVEGSFAAYALWKRRGTAREAPTVDGSRRLFLSRAVAGSAVLAGGGAAAFGTWRAFTAPEVTEVAIRLPLLPKALDGLTLVHLTDIHVGAVIQRKFMDELVARANALKPDLVAITGDLVDGSVSQLGYYVGALQNLRSRYGTFFVTGNHDYYSGADAWVAAVQGLGITPLRNRLVRVGDAGAALDLVGVDDWGSRQSGEGGYDLDKALAGRNPDHAAVLLAHQPSNFEVAAQSGIGLQLSGHTHGGQMFPATSIGRLIWGERNAGLSRLDDAHLYVSRGCGFVGPPMRVGSPPEIVKLTLLAGA